MQMDKHERFQHKYAACKTTYNHSTKWPLAFLLKKNKNKQY